VTQHCKQQGNEAGMSFAACNAKGHVNNFIVGVYVWLYIYSNFGHLPKLGRLTTIKVYNETCRYDGKYSLSFN
jgi:hypothetical protein